MAANQADEEVKVPPFLRLSKIVVWFMYFWVMIGIVSLTLRVFLLAFSANMSAGFSRFVSEVSADYLAPFRGIFQSRQLGDTGYLDVSAMFAIVVYLFIAWGVGALIAYVQAKIDLTTKEQQQQIAEKKRQVELATLKNQAAPAPAATVSRAKLPVRKV